MYHMKEETTKRSTRLLSLFMAGLMLITFGLPLRTLAADEGALITDSSEPAVQQVTSTQSTDSVEQNSAALQDVVYTAATADGLANVTVTGKSDALPADGYVVITRLEQQQDVDAVARQLDEKAAAAADEFSYEDFLAFDVTVYDAAGNEIEPTDAVTVQLNVDSALLPQDAAQQEFSVAHLKETEAQVQTETVQADLTVNADQGVEATFATDSFSTFAITWTGAYSATKITVTVHYVDSAGNEINGYQTANLAAVSLSRGDTKTQTVTASNYFKDIDGYSKTGIYFGKYNGTQIGTTSVTLSASRYNSKNTERYSLGFMADGTGSMQYVTSAGALSTTQTWLSSITANVYLVYTKNVPVSISDTIQTNGRLTATLGNTLVIQSTDTVTYNWYRNGSTTPVASVKVTGEQYNTGENWLNVPLDIEALCIGKTDEEKAQIRKEAYTYQVGVVINSGAEILSDSYTVPYYAQLQNGSFETPVCETSYQPYRTSGATDVYWKTTASDGKIEFVSADPYKYDGSSTHKDLSTTWHHVDAAQDGTQFAELNANYAGALYQDVLTVPSSNLFWQLYHRGRDKDGPSYLNSTNKDTMYVLIMSTSLAEKYQVTTQAKVNAVIASLQAGEDTYKGAQVWTISDDNRAWYEHDATYTVPADQYLTRFFFVSGATASGDETIGNHLDAVWFSPELPAPAADKGNLSIVKDVSGLDATTIPAESFVFEVKNSAGQLVQTVKLPTAGGSYSAALLNIDAGTYTVTEVTCPSELNALKYESTTYQVTGMAAATGKAATVAITASATTTARFTNIYASDTMQISKNWVTKTGTVVADADIPFASIQLDVVQYYRVTSGDTVTDHTVSSQTITLTKSNGWTANFSKMVYSYTAFKVTGERYYDANGNEVTAGDWTMGDFTFARNYGTATASFPSDNRVTTCANTSIKVPGNGIVLIKLTGSSNVDDYYVWAPYIDLMDASQILAMKQACVTAKPAGTGNISVDGIAVYDGSSPNVDIVYNNDGTVTLNMSASCTWAQVWYGTIQFADATVTGALTNVLNTDKTQTITLTKVWEDNSNSASTRPQQVTFNLLANGAASGSYTFTGTGDTWTKEVTVPVYTASGGTASYTVTEETVNGYVQKSNQGLTITNALGHAALTLTKTVTGNLTDADFAKLKETLVLTVTDGTDTFTVYGSSENTAAKAQVNPLVLTWNDRTGTIELTGTVGKTYTVTEAGGEVFGYKLTAALPASLTLPITGGTLQVTNSYVLQLGMITVSKAINGTNKNGYFQFELKNTLTGICYYVTIHGEGSKTVGNLPVGVYEVRELTNNSFKFISGGGTVYLGCTLEGGKLVADYEHLTATCPFLNEDNTNIFKDQDAVVNLKTNDGNGWASFKKEEDPTSGGDGDDDPDDA